MPQDLFQADWILPDAMKELGYKKLSDENSPEPEYYKYTNEGGTISPYYGPMFIGKRYIYFNCGYVANKLFVGVREDGDTRTVFNGIIETKDELLFILNSVI